jgi:Leucine-rich repeat (LRR) protein
MKALSLNGDFVNLRALSVNGNELTELPDIFEEHLEYLDCAQNRLTGLPSSLGHVSGLDFLDISGNAFAVLPGLLRHAEIEELRLGGNAFKNLPAWLYEKMYVGNNGICVRR